MKAAQFSAYGPAADMIECVELPDSPSPAVGEIKVDVLAFPINPADMLTIEGLYAERPPLPATLGAECIARVTETGKGVAHLSVGDLVVPLGRQNWVQQKTMPAKQAIKIPEGSDIQQLAMLRVNPPTAHLMMTQYVDLKAGDWLMQDAANSGVGKLIIQMAKAKGIRTVNVVRHPDAIPELKDLGADVVVVDSDNLAVEVKELTDGAEIRLGIDAVGGTQIIRMGDCLADEAIIVNYGLLSGDNPQLSAHQTVFKRLWLTGFWLLPWLQNTPPKEAIGLYSELANSIASGDLHVPVAATFPLTEIKDAMKLSRDYKRDGKVLVLPNGPI
jgi:mitochondrial enoyl-[acyl-carrier protein] reductase / trans-2-enoyl-CoA reductase